MKNLVSFIPLLIFVNTIANYMIGTESKEEGLPVPVLDTDGNKIRVGTSYFIRPVFRSMGGDITATIAEGISVYCVVQQKYDTVTGEPLIFLPDGYKVRDESTDLKIGFLLNFSCRQSTIWKVGDYDESTKQNFVMLGGSVGNLGNETVGNWFKVEKQIF